MTAENDSNSKKLQRFGRYLLLDHLVDGGMAKICRARFLSDDADKIVAIKMIQKQFSSDENFKQMFLDEIKVTFGLNHPNIAQTYDYGVYKDQLYTAMEYVDGANLKQFLDRLKKRKFVFPVEISVYIISQVCQGLTYAHSFRDKLTDKKLSIIHRDISPHNIMLTFDGAVKIIDFGIAKSNTNSEATQAGTIKGKLSYLAPEYLDGKDLDHRYDQFAVGITLWELLCSKKLFYNKNELAVLKQIQACKIPPPSSINPNVPKELDAIVMKSLNKDRELRYNDMDQFNRALVKFLYANYPEFNALDLSAFAKELFKQDIQKDRQKLFEFGKIDIQPYLNEWKGESNGGNKASAESKPADPKVKREVLSFDMDDSIHEMESEKSSTNKIFLEGAQTNTNFNDINRTRANISREKSSDSNIAPAAGRPRKRPANGTRVMKNVKKQEEEVSSNKAVPAVIIAGLIAFGFFKKDLVMTEVKKLCLTKSLCDKPSRDPAQEKNLGNGKIRFTGFRTYHDLYIDGVKKDYKLLGVSIPIGKKVKVVVSQRNRRSFETFVELTPDKPNQNIDIPEMERVSYGEIYANNDFPAGYTLSFEHSGKKVEKKIPFKGYRLPAGSYNGTLENKILGISKKVRFTIEQDKQTELKAP